MPSRTPMDTEYAYRVWGWQEPGARTLLGRAAVTTAAGLVDEVRLFVCPVVVGGGKGGLPRGGRIDLDLLDERRFGNGVVHLRYGTR